MAENNTLAHNTNCSRNFRREIRIMWRGKQNEAKCCWEREDETVLIRGGRRRLGLWKIYETEADGRVGILQRSGAAYE